jgi:hypothetical protein
MRFEDQTAPPVRGFAMTFTHEEVELIYRVLSERSVEIFKTNRASAFGRAIDNLLAKIDHAQGVLRKGGVR